MISKEIKRFSSLSCAVILAFFLILTPVSADTGITAEYKTQNYDADTGTVIGELIISNTSEYNISGIELSSELPFECKTPGGSAAVSELVIAPGESLTLNVSFTAELNSITVWFIAGGCAAAAVVIAVLFVILRKKKHVTAVVSVLLCVSAFLTVTAVSADELQNSDAGCITDLNFLGAEIRQDLTEYQQLKLSASYNNNSKQDYTVNVKLKSGAAIKNTSITVSYYGDGFSILEEGFRTVPSGMLEKDTDLVSCSLYGADLISSEVSSGSWAGTVEKPSDADVFYAVTDGIDVRNYAQDYICAAYVRYMYKGSEYITFSDTVHTSVKSVANKIYSADDTGEELKEFVKVNITRKIGSLDIVNEEKSDGLRQKICDEMDKLASVEWIPETDIKTNGQTNFETPVYKAGTVYLGLPYNAALGSVESFSELLSADKILGKFYTSDITDFWYNVPGLSCSTSVISAYTEFTNSIGKITGAMTMLPFQNNGYSAIGSYKQLDYFSTTGEILALNTEQTIYEAYAEMKQADLLVSVRKNTSGEYLGHVVMAYADPVIVRNSDGTINGEKSKIRTVEQTSGISDMGTYSTTWIYSERSFHVLYAGSMKFIPVGVDDIASGYTAPAFCVLNDANVEKWCTDGIDGKLVSNYAVKKITVTLTSETGETLASVCEYTGLDREYDLADSGKFGNLIKSATASSFTVTLTAHVKNEDVIILQKKISR